MEANTKADLEHVVEVEISISMVKEHGICVIKTLPYACLLAQITVLLVYVVIMWLSYIPARNLVSEQYLTIEIFTGSCLDFKKHCKVVFGSYVEEHKNLVVTNNTTPITYEFISLEPTGNLQRTQKVFCLNTQQVLKLRKIETMVEPDIIIKLVNSCPKGQKVAVWTKTGAT